VDKNQNSLITFEDFTRAINSSLPKKSKRWIEIAYREFNESILSEKTPLSISILKLIPLIVDEDIVHENFLKIKVNMLFKQAPSHSKLNKSLLSKAAT
jgi:hypothetical protein